MFSIRKKTIGLYVFICFIFLNFGIYVLPDYQLTVASIYPFVFLLMGRLKFTKTHFLILCCILCYPIFTLFISYFSVMSLDLIAFVRSYALYIHFCIGIFIALNIQINREILPSLNSAIFWSLVMVIGCTLLQVVGTYIVGYPIFFNLFGEYSIGGVYDPYRFLGVNGIVRPAAFYWEPSTNSLVIFILTNTLIIYNLAKIKRYLLVQLFVMLAINTATGLFASLLVVMAWINKLFRRYFLLKFVFLTIAIIIMWLNIGDRLAEITWEGTSGHYRWAVPFGYLAEYFPNYPLGLPLGQLYYPLDNGLFVFLIYFGIVGILFFAVGLLSLTFLIFFNKIKFETLILLLSILLLMTFNGAFLTPEMSFLIATSCLMWRGRESAGVNFSIAREHVSLTKKVLS